MTRDEAITAVSVVFGGTHGGDEFWCMKFVEAVNRLGMLKLDEPKSMKGRVEELLVGKHLATCSVKTMGAEIGLSDVDYICRILDADGLKIVEKDRP